MRLTVTLISCFLLCACTGVREWYRVTQEKAAVIEVRQQIRRFEATHNKKPQVISGSIKPCKWDLSTPLPQITAYEQTQGLYRPFRGDFGEILYPAGDYDSLRHEIAHHYNWRTPVSWRCLDEYFASRIARDSQYTPTTRLEKRHYASKLRSPR